MQTLSLEDKLTLMIQIAQAIAFCHSKGVFHRNMHAGNVLVSTDFDEIRVRGFEFAKDVELTRTVLDSDRRRRDPRVIPPEELLRKEAINLRAYDVYQTGLLFYRILENGKWPFEEALDYTTGNGSFREMTGHTESPQIAPIRQLVGEMLTIDPSGRPDPMSRVEGGLNRITG